MESTFALNLTPEEYRAVMRRRIEACLREARIPDEIVAGVLEAYARTTAAVIAPVHRPTVQEQRARGEAPEPIARDDQRQKAHWPSPKARPVEEPGSIADSVLNAMFKGCRTVPEIAKETKKTPKSIYTALWALKKARLIDQGEPPA